MSDRHGSTHERFVRFVPGPGVALVAARVVGLIRDDPRSPLVKELWSLVAGGVAVDELLERLAGVGLSNLPSLGFVAVEPDGVRVLVRGDVTAVMEQVQGGGPAISVNAEGVRTWVEHVESAVGSVQLRLADELSELGAFEVSYGLIPAGRVEMVVERHGAADPNPFIPAFHRPLDEPIPAREAPEEELAAEPDPALRSDEPGGEPSPDDAVEASDDAVEASDDAVEASDDAVEASDHAAEPDVVREPDVTPAPAGSDPAEELGEPDVGPDEPAASDALAEVDDSAPGVPDSNDTLMGPFEEDRAERQESEALEVDPAPLAAAESGPVVEEDYDHLFGATQYRTVEDAAVRPPEDDAADEVEPTPLISSAPGSLPSAHHQSPPPFPGAPPVSSLEDSDDGDHDGHTISLAELRGARGDVAPPGPGPDTPSTGVPMVHAIRCPAEHLNPTHATDCRVCGAPLDDQAHVTVPRPVLGVLQFSDGRSFEVVRPMLLGRAPRAEGSVAGDLPQLVTVPSPLKEVSSTHLEIRLEGWQLLVVDRQSTNGTVITLPGRDAQRLRPGEPFPITIGTAVNLADEAEFVFGAPR